MSRSVVDAELRVFHPRAEEPHEVVPGRDLSQVKIEERGQGEIDQGSFVVANDDGAYDGVDVTAGDRLEFYVKIAEEPKMSQLWTAVAKPPTWSLDGGRQRSVEIPARDFVFAVLSWRLAFDGFDDRSIAGGPDAILNRLLAAEAPEVGRSQVADVPQTTDLFADGRDLRSIVVEDLAPLSDAIVAQDGTDLVFTPLADTDVTHALTPEDFRGSVQVSGDDAELATLIRVDGGTAHETDDAQLSQTGTERVTRTEMKTARVQTRKSEIDRIQIWIQRDPDSTDSLTVRLQADRDGQPVSLSSGESDIASRTLAAEFLSDGGFTTFLLPDHTLAPGDDPWLVVQADGETGHLVGVDDTGALAFQAEYPYPLLTRNRDEDAAREYRRRDHRIRDDSLDTFESVRDKARSYLIHHDRPTRTLSGEAESLRAHRLQPGDLVDTTVGDWHGAPVSGAYAVTKRTATIDERSRLSVDLTLQEARSL